MKSISIIATFLSLCLTTALYAQQPATAPHTFTSTDGRKLTATVIEKTATSVTLRRAEDGKDFILQIDRLSAADQAFVKAWGTKAAAAGATTSPGGLVKTWMLEPQWDGVGLFGDGLAPVKLGGKWGFIDETGKMVIPPTWDEALSFADGLAPVQKDGQWGYIDKTGKIVVELTWDGAEVFSGGAATVVKNGKHGFIDTTGKVISEPKWVAVENFTHGLAVVNTAPHNLDGTIAVINLKGETVFEQPRRKSSKSPITVSEYGICVIDEETRARFMNSAGKVLFEQPVAQQIEFHEGLAAVWVKEDQLAFIDPTGAVVTEPISCKSSPNGFVPAQIKTAQYRFSEGLAAVPGKRGDRKHLLGYIDKAGKKMVIDAQWAQAGPFSEGLALVSESEEINGNKEGIWSIIDKKGNPVASVQVQTGGSLWANGKIASFQNGLVQFHVPGGLYTVGYLDHTGKVAIPPNFYMAEQIPGGAISVNMVTLRTTNFGSDSAIIDTTGAVIVALSLPQSRPLSLTEPISAAASPRRYGLVNHAGKVVMPPAWEDAEILSPDLVAFRVNEKLGLVNATGQIVLPATIENIGAVQYHDDTSVSVLQGSQWSLLDIKSGKITASDEPDRANKKATFPDDFSPFEENKLWGVKAKAGTVLVAAQYGGMRQASKDRFWVNKAANESEENWGLMTQTGQMLSELEWNRMTAGSSDRPGSAVFTNGRVLVTKGRLGNMAEGGLSGYMDENGKLVVPLSLGRKSSFAHGAAMVWNAKESGLINTKGEWIFKSNAGAELSEIGFESRFTGHFQHGLALIETPLKWGFVKLSKARP